MTDSTAVLIALAAEMTDAGLWQPFSISAKYREIADRPAPALEELPSKPDTAVSLAVVNDMRDRDQWNPDIYVRLRFRAPEGDPRAVHRLADSGFDHLHTPEAMGERFVWPGGVIVQTCLRVGWTKAARDTNGRWMKADTYRITLNPGSGD